jgi:hypothetical protein
MKINDAIERYIKLRDKKAEIKKRHAAELEKYETALKKLEAGFLKLFEKSGQTSAKVNGVGIAFVKERTSDKVTDRAAFLRFVKSNDAFDFVESRVSKAALDEYIEEHGDMPPGVSRSTERVVNVRRG